ncbi:hypothetical protein BKA62DRAFT_722031 [Auriculariales sp. MPI-PUGE-AT-0066]|nr:hypothetical protein BKA62DRAFT_722031 [Auriculariales sp. MPI-PUGE-AT-0066]
MLPPAMSLARYIFALLCIFLAVKAHAVGPDAIRLDTAPGYLDLSTCAQGCLVDLGNGGPETVDQFVECGTNACMCAANHQEMVLRYTYDCASDWCANPDDADDARAIVRMYCQKLGYKAIDETTGQPTGTEGPLSTVTVNGTGVATVTMTVTGASSKRSLGSAGLALSFLMLSMNLI